MIQNLLKNWKTTSAGLTLIIGSIVHLVFTFHTADEATWTASLTAIGGGLGLIFAGDANVPSAAAVETAAAVDKINQQGPNPMAPSISTATAKGSIPAALLIGLLSLGLMIGCGTTPQRTAFNTIGSVEATASAAVDGYYTAVIKGQATTNAVPQVSKMFNQLQAACTLAATVDQAGTNAIAPANLTDELSQLLSLTAILIQK